MPNIQQSVTVCQELQVVLGIVCALAADVKAGKAPAAVVGDALPQLISALSGLSALSTEVTPANGAAVDATILLFAGNLKQVLLPGVV